MPGVRNFAGEKISGNQYWTKFNLRICRHFNLLSLFGSNQTVTKSTSTNILNHRFSDLIDFDTLFADRKSKLTGEKLNVKDPNTKDKCLKRPQKLVVFHFPLYSTEFVVFDQTYSVVFRSLRLSVLVTSQLWATCHLAH